VALSATSVAVQGFNSSSLFEQIQAGMETASEQERKGFFLFFSLFLFSFFFFLLLSEIEFISFL